MAGLYAQGTPKGGYPMQAVAGPPKAASVHEMDMSPSQPGATKRRGKAGRDPTSAPGPYGQNWGNPGAPFMGMTGQMLPCVNGHVVWPSILTCNTNATVCICFVSSCCLCPMTMEYMSTTAAEWPAVRLTQ